MSTNTVGSDSGTRSKKLWTRVGIIASGIVLAFVLLPFVILPALGVSRILTISTSGMEPTFSSGDRILSNELAYKFGDPQRGDLAVFNMEGIVDLPPNATDVLYVKRVAGLPGEKIAVHDGEVFINGQKAADLSMFHYATMQGSRYLGLENDELLIPADSYFMLGDNSRHSADSRLWGFIPRANFRGRVIARLWHGSKPKS